MVPGVWHREDERDSRFGRMEMDLHHRKLFIPVAETTANRIFKEGLLTFVIAIAAYFFIYDYPATAKFLTPKEKAFVIARLNEDNDATRDEKFTWGGVIDALKDPKVWLYGLSFYTVNLPICTLGLFLPTIITELGYTAAQAQLLSIPPYVGAFTLTMTFVLFAERTKLRAPFIISSSSVAIVGYIILIASNRPTVSYGGALMGLSGAFSAAAITVSWPANNVSGQTKRATASAMQLSVGNLGAVMGTQLYRSKWAPKYYVGNGVVWFFIGFHPNGL
jgi:cyanate permease